MRHTKFFILALLHYKAGFTVKVMFYKRAQKVNNFWQLV